jgi:hypothetical protein
MPVNLPQVSDGLVSEHEFSTCTDTGRSPEPAGPSSCYGDFATHRDACAQATHHLWSRTKRLCIVGPPSFYMAA